MAALEEYLASIAQPGVGVTAPVGGLPVPAPASAPQVSQPTFLENMANPTGNSAMLLDLAARLSRAPQVGQSGFSAALGSTSEALKGQTARKASKTATELSTREKELGMATEQRTLDSADLRDDLTRSIIGKNDRSPAGGRGGSAAPKVQLMQLRAKTLRANHPEIYGTDAEAMEAAFTLTESKDGHARVLADAQAKFTQENEFVLDTAEMDAGLERIKNSFKALGELPDPLPLSPRPETPEVTPAVVGTPPPAGTGQPTPQQFAAMDKKTFGDWARARAPGIDNATIAQAYADTRGKAVPKSSSPKPKAPPKKALTPAQRKQRRVDKAAGVKKSRAAGKAKAAVKDYLQTSFKDLSKTEMRTYLRAHRKDMSPNDFRKYGGIMRMKGK